MYSPLVIDKLLFNAKKQGLKFQIRSVDESRSITEKLTTDVKARKDFGITIAPDGTRKFHGLSDRCVSTASFDSVGKGCVTRVKTN